MNKKAFTIISLGNYETKIFCCFTNDKEHINPFYKDSFITKDYFENSRIIDLELFKQKLKDKIKMIPIDIHQTDVILNIPLKEVKISNYISEEYIINQNFSKEIWNSIFNVVKDNFTISGYEILDKKTYLWTVDGKDYLYPPYGKKVEKLNFKSKIYYLKKDDLDKYLEALNFSNISVLGIVCDSIVMQHFFDKPERRFKLLFNIGHIQSSFEIFDNLVLSGQKKINFGIKNLTKQISELANVSELDSIEILKMYKDLVWTDKDTPIVNLFKEKFLDYKQIKVLDISMLIVNWLKDLITLVNDHLKYLFTQSFDVDEIYFYSSTNIFEAWIDFIQSKLSKFVDIKIISTNIIGVSELKFASLIASVIHFIGK